MRIGLLFLILCLGILSACTPTPRDADSGFDPSEHGFSFQNYTTGDDVVNLSAGEVQRMFGDQVCANIIAGVCTLTPPAKYWMEEVNRAMINGHCEGMAVLSELMFFGEIDPLDFGAESANALVLDGNDALQREIAYWWATQVTYPGASVKVNSSPSQVLETLQDAFSQGEQVQEAWALGIYQPDMSAGHSITPAAVVHQGEGIYHIMVYDNNFPNELRPLIVDTNQDTWQYVGSTDPDKPGALYQGDASTRTLEAVAISPRLERQDCFFCQGSDQSWLRNNAPVEVEGDYYEIWLQGDADLRIVDKEGHRLGYVNGEMVNEIPGARISWLRTHTENEAVELTPHYLVPVDLSLDFQVDGGRLETPGYSSFSLIGPGGFLSIEKLWVRPGETQEVSVWVDGSRYQVIFWHNDIETPVLRIGYESPQADYTFLVQATELITGEDELDVTVDIESGAFIISTDWNVAPATYGMYIQRIDKDGVYAFGAPAFSLAPDTTVTLIYNEWGGEDDMMRALIDYSSDGQIDEVVDLPNEGGGEHYE